MRTALYPCCSAVWSSPSSAIYTAERIVSLREDSDAGLIRRYGRQKEVACMRQIKTGQLRHLRPAGKRTHASGFKRDERRQKERMRLPAEQI